MHLCPSVSRREHRFSADDKITGAYGLPSLPINFSVPGSGNPVVQGAIDQTFGSIPLPGNLLRSDGDGKVGIQ